jgi:hypothetical protein
VGIATKTLKKATRKARTWFMDRVGSQLVSSIADTSADAPNASHKPKRDLYNKMKQQEAAKKDNPA